MSVTVRPGRVTDYPLFARLFVELGVPEPPPAEERFAGWMLPRILIASDEDDEVGYAFWQVYGEVGHVVNVVVAAAARSRGVGRALMEAVRESCRREGCTRWYLNVKQDNLPAMALYRRCGLQPAGELWPLRLPFTAAAALPVEEAPPAPYAPGPDEDAALARFSGLPPARLAVLRARPGVVLRALREGEAVQGFAAFDPHGPVINPLRLARPTLLRPLLESLRAEAADHPFVIVAVERDRAVRDAVQAAGGELLFALVEMGAPLERR